MNKYFSPRHGLAIATFFSLRLIASQPAAFLVCPLKGDELEPACARTEARFRSAGYDVHRIDGPEFRGRQEFEAALQAADHPLVMVVGHGSVRANGTHQIHLGKDGAKQSYPTHLFIEGFTKLNPRAQIFVESCRSGQLNKELGFPKVCVGVSCEADELSPVSVDYNREGKLERAEGAIFQPVLDLLNLPANDFKYWSGGKCEIGGEALQNYLRIKLSGGTMELKCEVRGFDRGKERPPATVRAEVALCEKKVAVLSREPSVQASAQADYLFEVKCTDFKPGEKLRLYNRFASPEAVLAVLKQPKRERGPSGIKWDDHESYWAEDLAGHGCEPVPGFFAKRYTVNLSYRAERDGRPAFTDARSALKEPRTLAATMPFVLRWQEGLPMSVDEERERNRPKTVVFGGGDAEPARGMATPNFAGLVFRHARCTEGEYRRPVRIGAGLSARDHADAFGEP